MKSGLARKDDVRRFVLVVVSDLYYVDIAHRPALRLGWMRQLAYLLNKPAALCEFSAASSLGRSNTVTLQLGSKTR